MEITIKHEYIADINILEQSGSIDTYDMTIATLNALKETGSDIARDYAILRFLD